MTTPCLDALETETRSSVVARRNFHFGLWAGRQLGLGDQALAAYAQDVMAADLEEAGPYDMIHKVAADLRATVADEVDLLDRLRRIERQARHELLVTD
jgi:hypothetical protein